MEAFLIIGALAVGASMLDNDDKVDSPAYKPHQISVDGGYLHNTKPQDSEVKWVFMYD